MKVRLLRRIRKNWKIYRNDNPKGYFTYHAYRKGKHRTEGTDLHSLKRYIFEAEALECMFISYTDWKAKRNRMRFRKKLVQVYP